jgi:hypothetical protein
MLSLFICSKVLDKKNYPRIAELVYNSQHSALKKFREKRKVRRTNKKVHCDWAPVMKIMVTVIISQTGSI